MNTAVAPQPLLTRRTVLASAAVGTAAMAAARLVHAPELEAYRSYVSTVAGARRGLDWISPLGADAARVAHLLRRTTFGASASELETASADGFKRTVERLLETPPAEPLPLLDMENASPARPIRLNALQEWWVSHTLTTPTPFAEWMTLFWHDHFPSDFRKVGLQSPFIYWQNFTWRRLALSDLRSILYAVTVDPAMLRYLDLATSTGQNPNENYARELIELFTMGAGTFSEEDVRAGSRALAGWREPRTAAMVLAQIERAQQQGRPAPRVAPADEVKTGVFEPRRAYRGEVTFLGKTGRFDTEAVIDRILAQDVTAPFIARKAAAALVSPTPDEGFVKRLAANFRASGYQTRQLLYDVLTSAEFVADAAYRSLVKSPAELMVHVARALEAREAFVPLIVQSGAGMGQVLFDPPQVGGWPTNEAWISSGSLLARANFVRAALGRTGRRLPPAKDSADRHLDGVLSPTTARLLADAKTDVEHWTILLASPEFQLK